MAVKFSEFAIGTIDADLELVGFNSATPENVQVSYSDIKTDILADAQSPLNGTGFVKISGTTITYDNSTYLTSVSIANINATGTPSSTTFLRGDGQWATPTGGAATIAIGSSITSSTVGSVLFVGTGGVLAQNNSNFFWDNTNNRLGIGITAPLTGIHVLGEITVKNTNNNNLIFSNKFQNNCFVTSIIPNITSTATFNTAVGMEAMSLVSTGVGNAALGYQSSTSITTGSNNTSIGFYSLRLNQTGSTNVAIGRQALENNTVNDNIAVGVNAARVNSTGTAIVAIGKQALENTTGSNNTALGYFAGIANSTGTNNIFIGANSAGVSITESNRTWIGNASTTSTWVGGNLLVGTTTNGTEKLQVNGDALINGIKAGRGIGNIPSNTAFGVQALNANTSGDGNTAIGNTALKANTSAYGNTAVGSGALTSNTTGVFNTAIGAAALTAATTASSNVAIGARAAQSLTTAINIVAIGQGAFQNGIASNNIMIGNSAGLTFTSATANDNVLIGTTAGDFSGGYSKTTLVGHRALSVTTTGTNNIALGYEAGGNNTTGSNNIFIGVSALAASPTESNRTFIGNASTTATWLGGDLLLGSTTDNGTDILQVTGSALITGVLKETIVTNRQTASYALALADRGKLVEMNVATANNLTVPASGTINFPVGTQIDISQYGAGQTTVVAAVGVTIRSASGGLKLAVQYSGGSLVKIGTDEWYLFGDITV